MLGTLMGVIRRLFLFSFFFLFAYLHMKNIKNSSYEFKDKVYEFTTLVNFKSPQIETLLRFPENFFHGYLIFQTACAVLAILGVRFFSFVSGICLVLLNAIYYNPFKINPATKKPDLVYTSLNLDLFKSLPWEFIVISVLALAIFTQSTESLCCSRVEILPKEAGASIQQSDDRDKREPKVHSQKAKKKI